MAPETENPAAPWWSCGMWTSAMRQGRTFCVDLNMEIREGELATLSGRTGAGKSTVFKLHVGCMPPGGAPSGSRAWIPVPHPGPSGGRCTAMSTWFHPVPGTIRDQITLYDDTITEGAGLQPGRGAGGTGGGHRHPARRLRHPLHPVSLRDSGSCCPSPGRWRPDQAASAGRDRRQSGRGDGAGGAAGHRTAEARTSTHFSPGRGGHGTAHSHWGGVIARNRWPG